MAAVLLPHEPSPNPPPLLPPRRSRTSLNTTKLHQPIVPACSDGVMAMV
jgi:hypothetical protein